ncbi:MAG: translocation/assembly module TamB domain-containing protein, partial [Bacteroidota bacterium]|nr:translocation/assembly module TamB domain-containing protein [Bacteroidota bacterium]
NGLASGDLQLLGSSRFPYLKGTVNVQKGTFKIDYLNTRYTFDDKVSFDQDAIHFDNFIARDTLGNAGIVNGKVKNKSFNNWMIDLSLNAKNLLGFNKDYSYSELYYGKAFGSGVISLKGPPENLNVAVNAKTEKDTRIYIPLNNPGTVSENDFITFINKSDTLQSAQPASLATPTGMSMNMTVDVTDNANIQLFLPYEMGNIKGSGNGRLNMDLSNMGDFSIKGDYRISNGIFQFTLPKYTLSRSFNILDGSIIHWNGSPYDATINLKAAYKTKVSLSSLPNNTSQLSQRIDVDCIISLKDNLFKPKIKFAIELPGADESMKQLVFSAIDTTNEAEMNQQMISLLVVGNFSLYNESKSLASSLGAQPYELISSQLNSMLSQISSEFDVGFAYRPGDALTTDEVELMLSKRLFNDRLRVEVNGNFPTSNTTTNNVQRSSNLVGDVNLEYKLTPDGRLMMKAYNKVNRDILDIYAPYKQGIGISYRKEFDYFRDLFRKRNKTVRKAK